MTFSPAEGFEGDPTPIAYEVSDLSGDVTGASITVGVVPVAADDADVDNVPGTAVAVDVLANDAGVLDPTTVALVDADDVVLDAGESLVVDGEGVWSIDPTTGAVTFTPEEGFLGDPTPIRYEVADLSGDRTQATITVGYVGVAVADLDEGNAVGDAVTVPVLDNDLGVFDPATVALLDPATGEALEAGAELVVAGQGTWSIDPETGDVTFTPADGYEGDPTVVTYQVADLSGDLTQATITITYVPAAVADVDEGNAIGEPASIDVLANDVGEFDPTQLSLIDPTTGTVLAPGAALTVAGEGVWSIDPETGVVTFTPDAGYEGDPTVVSYQVPDGSGDVTSATITITYLPVAVDDRDVDNTVGTAVTIDVLANDAGVLDVATLALIDAQGIEQAPGAPLTVLGEGVWTIDGSTVTFTPEVGFQGNPTPVDYRVEDGSGDVATATIIVGYLGVAQPDADLGNAIGDAVTVPVLDNDSGAFDVTSVALVDPATGEALEAGAELVVEGEGTWSIDPETGDVTFTPEDGFEGDPTVVSYEVTDELGVSSRATITITYLPVAAADESLENAIGAAVAIDVLANDAGVFDVASLSLVAADGTVLGAGEPLVVAGEGTWSISGSVVTFTPEAGFEGDPTPISYEVTDLSGDVTGASITVDYLSVANDDADVDNVVGEAVAIDVLANDAGAFDVASLSLVGADGTVLDAGAPLVVEGEGTWSIDGSTVTFTPEEGFLGDPTPIDYEVTDGSGDTRSATITVGYVGDAQDDSDLGNAIGDAVTVPVLDNDLGEFDPATVAFLDPATGEALEAGAELVVDGEG
ncbi:MULTISPECIES: Ig-like domain-containing protein, partial [unclassified Agrococcus]|uniref:Ig-like domain-containing protein n=1 Tax=unclassified Agrococcus TaxID=2615065 RepID=UPI003614F450